MKSWFSLLVFVAATFVAMAHQGHYENIIFKKWHFKNDEKTIEGSYSFSKDGKVFVETPQQTLTSFPMERLTDEDQKFVQSKNQTIQQLQQQYNQTSKQSSWAGFVTSFLWLFFLAGLVVAVKRGQKSIGKPMLASFVVIAVIGFYGFTSKITTILNTDPNFIDSAFKSFKPHVNTFWDNNYFYVESKGIPTTHNMMVGISNHGWQQQVPIPQCYIGTNAWSIPLNPIIAANPVPVNANHFTRGAIAIAANGVAIFNPFTNTGVDALVDGQLDNYGGHCGRADDYHYHIAPLHLYSHTSATLPIAFALDGFAVYGSVEPDGSPMKSLDANHGHYGDNGVYHYHGTTAFPYMIGNMVGKVTEDTTFQIVPQAKARAVRPWLTPLSGALITSCVPNTTNNGYVLTYTLNGQTNTVDYSWDTNGIYTFKFTGPNGTTVSTFNGFKQCNVPTAVQEWVELESIIQIYPNPITDVLFLQLGNKDMEKDFQTMAIYSITGQKVAEKKEWTNNWSLRHLPKGSYFLKINFKNSDFSKKIILE